jgi:hypothetical protein
MGLLTLNKFQVALTLPLKIRMAPRDLWDEDSTQAVAPGLDIIDFRQYFEGEIDMSVYIQIQNNQANLSVKKNLEIKDSFLCKRSEQECGEVRNFFSNTLPLEILSGVQKQGH